MNRTFPTRAIALILGGAVLLQLGLLLSGFYRLEADESARSLMAWELSWRNALEPWIWPPFYKLVVGGFLRLYPDVFVAPRLLIGIAGLAMVLVLVALSRALFAPAAVAVVTAALAVLLPDRLIFGTTPMSDMYYLLAQGGGALLLLHWLRSGRTAALLWSCLLVLVAQTVRYEAMFFGVVLGLYLTWLLARRELGLGTYVAAGGILAAFPVLWVLDSFLWFGSLENLGITSQQYLAMYGHNHANALRNLPLTQFLRSLAYNPLLLLGLWMMWRQARGDAALRRWLWLVWLPLPVISAVTFASLSITMAASWRQASLWVLLLLPFEAAALTHIAARLRGFAWRRWALGALALAALGPLVLRDLRIADRARFSWETGEVRAERAIGLHLRDELDRLGGQALVDAKGQIDFLDVLTGSTVPERIVLSVDAPAQEVALAMPFTDGLPEARDPEKVLRYQSDRFALAAGGDAEALRRRDIRLILVRAPAYVAALDHSPLVVREQAFPGWVLYRVRPEALHVAGP
ncbi:hypothetical protein [Paracraurococcus lichenis]|uniref:Glycosyltransferase RgtA/B/C/D-like domain-containing protein n=1 Tax=Paracraurococcus lichenis TaxID=3064888 RepID=A0ABT9E0N4_9PROT|nr:hypothetical protein [Paracraurococcus sp. LOR1-02]MDO9709716.1 hypothetical protein [Paracraurococcus sp. LOR1-02]